METSCTVKYTVSECILKGSGGFFFMTLSRQMGRPTVSIPCTTCIPVIDKMTDLDPCEFRYKIRFKRTET